MCLAVGHVEQIGAVEQWQYIFIVIGSLAFRILLYAALKEGNIVDKRSYGSRFETIAHSDIKRLEDAVDRIKHGQ